MHVICETVRLVEQLCLNQFRISMKWLLKTNHLVKCYWYICVYCRSTFFKIFHIRQYNKLIHLSSRVAVWFFWNQMSTRSSLLLINSFNSGSAVNSNENAQSTPPLTKRSRRKRITTANQRVAANYRERKRMTNLNNAFARLRNVLPLQPVNRR